MAAGAQVVTSDWSSLPEVAGDAALLVDPGNAEALGKALRDLTRDEEMRRDLALRGIARAHLFTWGDAVRKTWAVYRNVLG